MDPETQPIEGTRVRYTNMRWGTLYAVLTGRIKPRSPKHLGKGWEAISERSGRRVVLDPSVLKSTESEP
jgi:hypothetical protein